MSARRGIAMAAALAAATVMALGVAGHAAADGRACAWDTDAFSFVGTPVEQARCLLRPVAIGGRVGDAHAVLPHALDAMVGRPVAFDATTLRTWLRTQGIDESGVGGSLDAPLSFTEGTQPRRARYFVIHDTSNLLCQREDFPANADAADAPWNLPERWTNDPQAHLFITRDGEAHAPQGRTFATPWRATKLEKFLREPSRGLFLHIENVQLRRPQAAVDAPLHRPDGECVNDRIAQHPGFSAAQTRRLALVYVAASVRAGEWLIPAYHAVLDTGFIGGHDDPQNFDIDAWTAEVCALRTALGDRCETP
ncbi:MAG: hypothetical protein KA144_06540 [Xanthomonadaceae bacterium]|nr:hypothetical protein [Xanthomonadaceae bacterium]